MAAILASSLNINDLRLTFLMKHIDRLGHEAEVHALLPDPEVEAGGDVSDPHGVVPVDVAARPLDARQLQPPQRPRLLHHRPALVHNDAGDRM